MCFEKNNLNYILYRPDGFEPSDRIYNYNLALLMKQQTINRSDSYKRHQTDSSLSYIEETHKLHIGIFYVLTLCALCVYEVQSSDGFWNCCFKNIVFGGFVSCK